MCCCGTPLEIFFLPLFVVCPDDVLSCYFKLLSSAVWWLKNITSQNKRNFLLYKYLKFCLDWWKIVMKNKLIERNAFYVQRWLVVWEKWTETCFKSFNKTNQITLFFLDVNFQFQASYLLKLRFNFPFSIFTLYLFSSSYFRTIIQPASQCNTSLQASLSSKLNKKKIEI